MATPGWKPRLRRAARSIGRGLGGRKLGLLALGVILMGCGGRPEALSVGFVNQTHHSDADLWTLWTAAQQSLSQEIDLNPLEQSFAGAPADRKSTRLNSSH